MLSCCIQTDVYPNVLKYWDLKIINFPFVPNGKFITLRCPKIRANYSLIIMCSNIGTPNNHHFPFGTNGKVVVLGVPILKHFRVSGNRDMDHLRYSNRQTDKVTDKVTDSKMQTKI